MALEYLPIMAQSGAPKPPRILVSPAKPSWRSVIQPVQQSRVALLTSGALLLAAQQPFTPKEDLTDRLVPSDPNAGEIVIEHHSGIGRVPKQDPEIAFPRTALAALARKGI